MMQTIEIFRETDINKKAIYRAIYAQEQAQGNTPGQALDSLEKIMEEKQNASNSLIILQRFQPDSFFTESQQKHLQKLMQQFHAAINEDSDLTPAEQVELEELIDAEWVAAISRSASIVNQSH